MKLQFIKSEDSQERRAPRGARGLKFYERQGLVGADPGRAPRGARGLKFEQVTDYDNLYKSRSSRSAWIEIGYALERQVAGGESRSSRSAWIEINTHI